MNNNLRVARMVVFYSWFVTAVVVLCVFGAKMFWTQQLPADFNEIYPALKSILAFVLPPFTVAASVYFSGKNVIGKSQSLDDKQRRHVIFFTLIYHLLFNAAVIAGIGYLAFERPKDITEALTANASAAGMIIGILSFLLIPVNTILLNASNDPLMKPVEESRQVSESIPEIKI